MKPETTHTPHGCLPPWKVEELPAPLPFSLRNALRTIGPGAILLVGAIGMGEWIAGPLFVVQHGRSVLWIATLAFVLQSLLNLEAVRYTLYTGEPVLTGFMRMRPGSKVWGGFYALAGFAQLGMPAAAAGCAGVAFAMLQGRAPTDGDGSMVTWITVALVLASAVVLASGKKGRASAGTAIVDDDHFHLQLSALGEFHLCSAEGLDQHVSGLFVLRLDS
jgi:hypothetical protein